jgi:hypothetical protein
MKKCIIAVHDQASKAYGQPIFAPAIGVAIRSFTDEVNNNHEHNQMYKHPSDFTLFDLGLYDDNTGEFLLHNQPIKLITAMDAKNPVDNKI